MFSRILEEYSGFKEKTFTELKFSYNDFLNAIGKINTELFSVNKIGKSFLDKDLFLIKIGQGSKRILMWSQMHGNEPVSTQGLFDVISFFNDKSNFVDLKKQILDQCTIYFLPLVNPDGAERFIRRNAQYIDLNRDALRQTAPEAQILNKVINEINPDFAFNLHDQERYYGTLNSNHPTAISFLTPSADFQKTIDLYRERSMKVIAQTYKMLQNYLPNTIAKYNDAFMPNAFGDNVQRRKISTLLFEAGYIIGDEQRQEVRKYYFLSILFAINSIAFSLFDEVELADYDAIPMNIKMKFCDYLFKNVKINQNGKEFATDIAVIRNVLDTEAFTDLIDEFIVWDIGDLSAKRAFVELDYSDRVFNKMFSRLQVVNIKSDILSDE